MKTKTLLLLAVVFAILVSASYLALSRFALFPFTGPSPSPTIEPTSSASSETPSPAVPETPTPDPTWPLPDSSKTITQTAATPEEKTALKSAEDFNYTNASNGVLHNREYPNYVGAEAINYYSSLVDKSTKGIILNCAETANTWGQTKVVLTGSSLRASGSNTETVSVTQSGWGIGTFMFLNGTQYQEVKDDTVSLNFSACYVVKMNLQASETFGPTNGFFCVIEQVVVLYSSFRPVAFGMQSQHTYA